MRTERPCVLAKGTGRGCGQAVVDGQCLGGSGTGLGALGQGENRFALVENNSLVSESEVERCRSWTARDGAAGARDGWRAAD